MPTALHDQNDLLGSSDIAVDVTVDAMALVFVLHVLAADVNPPQVLPRGGAKLRRAREDRETLRLRAPTRIHECQVALGERGSGAPPLTLSPEVRRAADDGDDCRQCDDGNRREP